VIWGLFFEIRGDKRLNQSSSPQMNDKERAGPTSPAFLFLRQKFLASFPAKVTSGLSC
jgi:hypothetical protein